jgi:hypothetical protein
MSDFLSTELNFASEIPSSLTYSKPISINLDSLKDDIRILILSKDKSLLRAYEFALLSGLRSKSGNDSLKVLMNLLRDYLSQKYKDDNVKNLTLRKNFDIIISCLECLTINNIDSNSDEINTLVLGFLAKNFI